MKTHSQNKLLVKYTCISLMCTPIITDVGCKKRQINISHKQYIITLTEFDSRSFLNLTKSCCHRELTNCTYCWVFFVHLFYEVIHTQLWYVSNMPKNKTDIHCVGNIFEIAWFFFIFILDSNRFNDLVVINLNSL